jgi:hypothetical protein
VVAAHHFPCPYFSTPRVLELTYTALDLTGFARHLNYPGDPFTWQGDRRFWLCAELDAPNFVRYGTDRDDVDYVMDALPIVRRKDIAAHGTYRTRHLAGLQRTANAGAGAPERVPEPSADAWTR